MSSFSTATLPFPRLVMEVIKRSPVMSPFLFRAFNHVLRRFSTEYDARADFGATFRCNLDDMIPRTIFYFGVWEPNNSALIGTLLKPGDVFVDVGANIGYYSLLASSLVGPKGQVISIEPSPAIFEQLSRNAAANAASNIRPLNVAAAHVRGELLLYGGTKWNRGATSTIIQTANQEPEAKVPAAPLDELLTPDEIGNVALIKIDIEGGELVVLRRLLETLDLYPDTMKILVELAPQVSGDELRIAFDAFLARGFSAFAVENEYDTGWYLRWRKPGALQRIDEMPARQMDILLVRNPDADLLSLLAPAPVSPDAAQA